MQSNTPRKFTPPVTVGNAPTVRDAPPPPENIGYRIMMWRNLLVLALLAVCTQVQAQNAQGAPTVTAADGTNLATTAPNEDSQLTATPTGVTDPNGIRTSSISWSWLQANTANALTVGGLGFVTRDSSGDTTSSSTFTPGQSLVGKYLYACMSFQDNASPRNTEQQCWVSAAAVANVDDAPTATDNTVRVATNRTSSNPHTFSADDFPFADEDGDTLVSVVIESAATNGTLSVNGTEVTSSNVPTTVAAASINTITYYPESGQSDNNAYATFTFEVITTTKTSASDATMTIDLFNPANATGTPSVAYASGGAPTQGIQITAAQNDIADPDNSPTSDLGTIAWQWSAADTNGGSYTDISTANAAAFAPAQAQVGKFLQVCASFTDSTSIMEQRCLQIEDAVINVNDAPAGMPVMRRLPSGGSITTLTSSATLTQGDYITSNISSGGGTVTDADGLPDGDDEEEWGFSWQTAPSGTGPWSEDLYDDSAGGHGYTPDDMDANGNPLGGGLLQDSVGMYLRVCVFYTDAQGAAEGGTRAAPTLCSIAIGPIANVNDAPVATANTVMVETSRTASTPHSFSADDFTFTDADGDELASVIIQTAPTAGAMSVGNTAVTSSNVPMTVAAASINTITYHPESGQPETTGYATFTFNVIDDGSDGSGDKTSTTAATITINLIEPRNATGTPTATPESPTEDVQITAAQGTVEDPDNTPSPTNLGTIAWQWGQADMSGGPYTDIEGATAAAFTPGDDQVGKFLQVCISFTDNIGIDESRCLQIATAVANINDAPSGSIAINTSDNSASTTALTALTEGTAYSLAATTGGGTLADPDGLPTGTARYIDSGEGISWQTAATANGPWTEVRITSDHLANGGGASYTPTQAQVDGYVRVCLFYADDQGTLEGGDSTSATTRAADATLCSTALQVANANSPPMALEHNLAVPTTASQTQPYTFKAADFPFTDEDQPADELASVELISVPSLGTMQVDGTDAMAGQVIAAADIGDITYWPASGQNVEAGYTLFMFKVIDDGDDPLSGDDTGNTSNTSTIYIDLVSATQTAASGRPTVSANSGMPYNEDVELRAGIGNINEPNGINRISLEWQWEQAPAPDTGTPADGDYSPIAAADERIFTPMQAQVGMYIRVCVHFRDNYEPPAAEGPLCSTGTQVTNVNDAPTSSDNTISVFTTASAAEPYTFKAADFPFMDEDGDSLASISIAVANLPTGATLTNDGTALTTDATTLSAADLGDLQFYPASDTTATEDYASLTFSVSDGTTTSDTHTLTINIVPPGPLAASGQPAITGTAAQGQTLTATRGTVADANGINDDTIMWQWQQAATADGTFTPIAGASGAEADEFMPTQAQVAQYVRVCMTFTDNHSTPTSEGPLCSATTGPIADVNDDPVAESVSYQAARDGNSNTVPIPVSAFTAAYMDADPDDSLASVTIITLPEPADGSLNLSNGAVQPGAVITITDGEFENGPLTFTIAESAGNLQETELTFTLSDGTASSDTATLTITFGKDIAEQEVVQASAILAAAAVTNATSAIGGAISSVPTTLSINGTSLKGLAQTLHQSKAADNPHHAWYHSTTANWEYTAAHNATDNSRASLLNRLQSMANGDIALNYSLTDMSTMRFWARYQSLDINGNEGESLEYDGSGTGFYLGADNQITETMRIGLAIGTDSSDITLDLDEDGTDDEATRSATSFYPYLHIDLGNNNNARVIAGFGSGTLDIKSTANSNSIASADLSWNMLAASISHHRPMKGNLSARFDGSLQLGNTSVDETTFSSGSTLMAADSSTNELSINAELRYQKNNITPFASLAARKLGGDISQSVALDMAFGADLQTNPANLRIAITRQINDTTHQRHSISLDASTRPSASGISASLGSRYDSITGRPQWNTRLRWQRRAAELSLAASPGDYRLQARLRW